MYITGLIIIDGLISYAELSGPITKSWLINQFMEFSLMAIGMIIVFGILCKKVIVSESQITVISMYGLLKASFKNNELHCTYKDSSLINPHGGVVSNEHIQLYDNQKTVTIYGVGTNKLNLLLDDIKEIINKR